MAENVEAIDISQMPEVLRLVEEIRAANTPRVLRNDDEDVAVLQPIRPPRKRRGKRVRTEANHQAFLDAAGSWKDVDTDKLIRDIYESRRRSSRPPMDL